MKEKIAENNMGLIDIVIFFSVYCLTRAELILINLLCMHASIRLFIDAFSICPINLKTRVLKYLLQV